MTQSPITAGQRATSAASERPVRKRRQYPRRSLRRSVSLSFAAGALLVTSGVSFGTYITTRTYMMQQRESVAVRQTWQDASFFREALLVPGKQVPEVLDSLQRQSNVAVFIRQDGKWYSNSLAVGTSAIPTQVQEAVARKEGAYGWNVLRDRDDQRMRAVVAGVAIPAVNVEFYEITMTQELDRMLATLPVTLASVAGVTSLLAAGVGWLITRRMLEPLDVVVDASTRIAQGELNTRLEPSVDEDLQPIVVSFNAMADAVSRLVERERRFAADVSHELRSPLTALTTSVHMLKGRRDEMPGRTGQVVDLMDVELERFSSALTDLLELSRLDAGVASDLEVIDIVEVTRQTLQATRRDPELLRLPSREQLAEGTRVLVEGDKRQLHRMFVNLLDNADKYGGGPVGIVVTCSETDVFVHVDDAGEGVEPQDRERIFERFVRAGSRGSTKGTGLGLSLVREMALAHQGSVHCTASPQGGARFTIRIPRLSDDNTAVIDQ